MPLIVNLSSIHTLHDQNVSIEAFVQLCNKYSKGYCPTFFNSWSNHAWVRYLYIMNQELIQKYKLGKINTEQFLKDLLHIFSFLKDIDTEQERAVKLNAGESYSEDFALALLESAWNEIIDLDETRAARFPELVAKSQNEKIYLISNTNELNVLKILRLLKKQNPEIEFYTPLDLEVLENKEPIKIANNIFLCLSYRYQLFKTVTDNSSVVEPHSTMSLLNYLVTKQLLPNVKIRNIKVVSQFPKDLTEAKKLNIPEENTFHADNFFNTTVLEIENSYQL